MPKKKPTAKSAGKKKRGARLSSQELRRRRNARRRVLFSILVLIVVAAVIFFLVLRNSNEISIAENGIGSLFSRVQSVFTGAANGIRDFVHRWRDFDRLETEYEALSLENQQLSLQLNSAQEAIREQELRIPRDISLAGYDGIPLTQTLRPQLTTIRQNSEALGEQAAKLLIMRLEQPETDVEEVVTIPVELIKGSTVGWCDVW